MAANCSGVRIGQALPSLRVVAGALLLTLASGCAGTIQSGVTGGEARLRHYRTILLAIPELSGPPAFLETPPPPPPPPVPAPRAQVTPPPAPATAQGQLPLNLRNALTRQDLLYLASRDIALALRDEGSQAAVGPGVADLVGILSLENVRFDTRMGWIAESATVEFTDSRSGEVVLRLRTVVTRATPTADILSEAVVAEVLAHY
jgi:hypothetical protein